MRVVVNWFVDEEVHFWGGFDRGSITLGGGELDFLTWGIGMGEGQSGSRWRWVSVIRRAAALKGYAKVC